MSIASVLLERQGLIYHSLQNPKHLQGILQDNTLKSASNPKIGQPSGVSFSRGKDSWYQGGAKSRERIIHPYTYRLAFDKEGVEKTGKLKPHEDIHARANEFPPDQLNPSYRVQELRRKKPVPDVSKNLRGIEVEYPDTHTHSSSFVRRISKRDTKEMERRRKKFRGDETSAIRQHSGVPIHFVDRFDKMDASRYMFHKKIENPSWEAPSKFKETHPHLFPRASFASRASGLISRLVGKGSK